MTSARQLYQLQEIDQAIDGEERTLKQKTGEIGESQALIAARTKLTAGQQGLAELKKQQQSAEWEADDLGNKVKTIDKKLYGGTVRNPKELTDLQHESNGLKAKRSEIDGKALELMERVEQAEASTAAASRDYKAAEQEWQGQQQRLAVEIDQIKKRLAILKEERQQAVTGIEPKVIELYEKLRKQKGQALARIEQGICRGCRISLSSNEIQQSRSGHLVQCSSCGRILYLQ